MRRHAAAWLVAAATALALLAGSARAETLAEAFRSRGLAPPAEATPFLDRALESWQVLDDAREVLVVFALTGREEPELRAVRLDRASGRWTTAAIALAGARAAGAQVADGWCRGSFALERVPSGFLVRAHVNPSAECTIALGRDLTVRGVLGGWPVAVLPDGRLVYQRNQVHFAAVHPVALGLWAPWDRAAAADIALYPRRPYQSLRQAHVARMRALYTDQWCAPRNHPCDPERFDEEMAGDVVADARGDTLAFVIAWDNWVGEDDREGRRRQAGAAQQPPELTEVVHVYVGVRRPATMQYREVLRSDFEARFGPGLPRRALDPDVVRALFGLGRDARPAPR